MATKYEVEFLQEQCRKLMAALDKSIKDKHALTARIMDNSEEAKTARAIADGLEWQVEELVSENAKLRELVRDYDKTLSSMHALCDCDFVPLNDAALIALRSRMYELGIEGPNES